MSFGLPGYTPLVVKKKDKEIPTVKVLDQLWKEADDFTVWTLNGWRDLSLERNLRSRTIYRIETTSSFLEVSQFQPLWSPKMELILPEEIKEGDHLLTSKIETPFLPFEQPSYMQAESYEQGARYLLLANFSRKEYQVSLVSKSGTRSFSLQEIFTEEGETVVRSSPIFEYSGYFYQINVPPGVQAGIGSLMVPSPRSFSDDGS